MQLFFFVIIIFIISSTKKWIFPDTSLLVAFSVLFSTANTLWSSRLNPAEEFLNEKWIVAANDRFQLIYTWHPTSPLGLTAFQEGSGGFAHMDSAFDEKGLGEESYVKGRKKIANWSLRVRKKWLVLLQWIQLCLGYILIITSSRKRCNIIAWRLPLNWAV